VGLRPVPLRQIVGTDSRGRDFDRAFLWIYDRRRELTPEYGRQQLGEAARGATEQLARERRGVRRLLRQASAH
jgi:hypothetical protein